MLILFATSCASYSKQGVSHEVRIIKKENSDANNLFVLSNEFLASYINSSKASIEYVDKENGKIIGNFTRKFIKGARPYTYDPIYEYIDYSYDIDVRNNMIRVRVNGEDIIINDFFSSEKTKIRPHIEFLDDFEKYILENEVF